MRPYSLRFLSDDLEQRYQDANMMGNIRYFRINMIFYFIIALIISICSYSDHRNTLAILASVYLIQIPLIYLMAKRSNQNFDICCLIFQICCWLCVPASQILGQMSGPIQGANSYIIGQAMTYIAVSHNMGSRFHLKVISLSINVIIQLLIKFIMNQETSTPLTICWVGTNFMILNFIYWSDRLKREAFQIKCNEKLWQSELGNFGQVGIMTCDVEDGQLLFDANKCNKICQGQFMITDLDSYKMFLKNVIIIPKVQFSLQILNNSRKLKKFKNLYSWIYKFSLSAQLDTREFIGLYKQSLYDFKIFRTWNEQLLSIHMLLTKSCQQNMSEELQLIKIEQKLTTDLGRKFTVQLKNILIELQTSKNQKSKNEQIMGLVYETMRLNFNLQIFLNPQHKTQKSHFYIQPLIDFLNTIILQTVLKPHKIKIQCIMNTKMKIHSCQKTLFHIIYNLYTLILSNTQQSGFIKLETHEKETKVGKFIMFLITTDIKFAQVLVDGRDNLQTISNKILNIERLCKQQNGLELIVSECLIGKIGPRRRIKFNKSFQQKPFWSFTIFQDLSVMD